MATGSYAQKGKASQVVVAHAFNPVLRRQRQIDLCEFEASLIYKASSRTAMAIQKNPVSKPKINK